MRRLFGAAILWLGLAATAAAQTFPGQLPAWNVYGNPSGSSADPQAATVMQMLNGVWGTPSAGYVPIATGPTTAAWGNVIPGDLNINSYGGTSGTLYSNTHFGECAPSPPNCDGQGFFTSGAGTTLNERYLSNYFAQTAIYANTTRDATQGETGLYLTMATATGYQGGGGATGQKAALQISGFAYPGGGNFWDAAMSVTFASGWHGASGNFGSVLELDPTNNDVDPVPIGGSTTTIIGLWLAGQIGSHPITSYLQMTPAGLNGTNFAAYYGLFAGNQYAIQFATVEDQTHSFVSYDDMGVHTVGINLGGTYSGFQIAGTGWGVSPAGKVSSAGYVATAVAPTVAAAQIGYGSTVTANSNCGTLAGSAGCVVINVAGTTRYVPYY